MQIHAKGESGHTIIAGTTIYNSRGLVEKQYVSQDIAAVLSAYYDTGIANWKHTAYEYDALGRVTLQTNPDDTTVSHDYSTAWQTTTTNENGNRKDYIFDAFKRLTRVVEYPEIYLYEAKWGTFGSGNGQFFYPLGIAVDSQGYIYVADTGNNRIQKFNSDGTFQAKWGSFGTENGQFNAPSGIAADSQGYIFVADTDNDRIQKFDSAGNFQTMWGVSGSDNGELNSPCGAAIDSQGVAYVTDKFNNRVQKFRYVSTSTTSYQYDIAGNLTGVEDNNSNITEMDYNWLSRKTGMTDPDMGTWSYDYDANGNLTSQTDNKDQTITLTYDALNRLTGKTYPAGLGMTNISYVYDAYQAGVNYGKGKRTSMTDALGANSHTWKYDSRGRLINEIKTIDAVPYTTSYTYDGADRIYQITYPTGEVVTNGYNLRGLPYSLSGNQAGSLATSAYYNQLGSITEINLYNTSGSNKVTWGYCGTGGAYDTAGGYYGRLWEIRTTKQPAGTPVLQDIRHTWDAGGNLVQREDLVNSETESFHYDSLDRLIEVNGAYS